MVDNRLSRVMIAENFCTCRRRKEKLALHLNTFQQTELCVLEWAISLKFIFNLRSFTIIAYSERSDDLIVAQE